MIVDQWSMNHIAVLLCKVTLTCHVLLHSHWLFVGFPLFSSWRLGISTSSKTSWAWFLASLRWFSQVARQRDVPEFESPIFCKSYISLMHHMTSNNMRHVIFIITLSAGFAILIEQHGLIFDGAGLVWCNRVKVILRQRCNRLQMLLRILKCPSPMQCIPCGLNCCGVFHFFIRFSMGNWVIRSFII